MLANRWAGVFSKINPQTVMVVIGIESNFKADVVNTNDRAMKRGGAWGYMQMTLDTAKDLVPRMPQSLAVVGKFDGTGRSLLDPELNVAIGTFYLDKLAREFKDFDLVVAAYQQGPGNIRRWKNEGLSKSDILARIGPHGQEYVAAANRMKTQLEATV